MRPGQKNYNTVMTVVVCPAGYHPQPSSQVTHLSLIYWPPAGLLPYYSPYPLSSPRSCPSHWPWSRYLLMSRLHCPLLWCDAHFDKDYQLFAVTGAAPDTRHVSAAESEDQQIDNINYRRFSADPSQHSLWSNVSLKTPLSEKNPVQIFTDLDQKWETFVQQNRRCLWTF